MRRRSQVKMIINFLVVLAVAACDAQTTAPIIEVTDSVNVRDFGAKGDSQTDDSYAFAAALDALPASGGVLRVPAGTYIVEAPAIPYVHGGIDLFERHNITIVGDGIDATTIRLAGIDYAGRGDSHLLFLKASSGISVQDLTLDGNRHVATFPDEQNHCVEVWSSTHLRFERVRFTRCRGDGIRLFGNSTVGTGWTEHVLVTRSIFEDNGRSGIAHQRGVRHEVVEHSVFRNISDQHIDMEPTGGDTLQLPHDIRFSYNHFTHFTQSYVVTLTGHNITFDNNRIENGSVFIRDIDSLRFELNYIQGDPTRRPLGVAKRAIGIDIIGNTILDQRPSGTPNAQGALSVEFAVATYPSGVRIIDNEIHATNGGINLSDGEYVEVVGNTIRGSGAGPGIFATNILCLDVPRRGLRIVSNQINDFAEGVRINKRDTGDAYDSPEIAENAFTGVSTPVIMQGTGTTC